MRRTLIERNTPPEWNVKVLTEAHFWDYCAARKITVREVELETNGYSEVKARGARIYVRRGLRGAELTHTYFHELAHHWLHGPGIQHYCGVNSKIEFEANVIAACAMVPRPLIQHHWPSEIMELYGYPKWLIDFRQKLLEYWEI